MSLEAKRSRHVAVAIPKVRVRRGIAVRLRQQSPQSQQPDVTYHQTLIGRPDTHHLCDDSVEVSLAADARGMSPAQLNAVTK
jgi:hypothetical protein